MLGFMFHSVSNFSALLQHTLLILLVPFFEIAEVYLQAIARYCFLIILVDQWDRYGVVISWLLYVGLLL
jgi:hypothetical protein